MNPAVEDDDGGGTTFPQTRCCRIIVIITVSQSLARRRQQRRCHSDRTLASLTAWQCRRRPYPYHPPSGWWLVPVVVAFVLLWPTATAATAASSSSSSTAGTVPPLRHKCDRPTQPVFSVSGSNNNNQVASFSPQDTVHDGHDQSGWWWDGKKCHGRRQQQQSQSQVPLTTTAAAAAAPTIIGRTLFPREDGDCDTTNGNDNPHHHPTIGITTTTTLAASRHQWAFLWRDVEREWNVWDTTTEPAHIHHNIHNRPTTRQRYRRLSTDHSSSKDTTLTAAASPTPAAATMLSSSNSRYTPLNNRGSDSSGGDPSQYRRRPSQRNSSSSSSSTGSTSSFFQPVTEWWSTHFTGNGGSHHHRWPKIQCRIEPTTTLKIRKTFRPLHTILKLSAQFNTQLGVWQFHTSWEDAIIGGKLTLAGRKELQLTKSWTLSVGGPGLVEDLVTRLRLRAAVDLQTWKAYVRVGFRTERLAPINVMEGFALVQQIPLDGVNGKVKLEVKANFALPEPEIEYSTETHRSLVGMGDVEVSIEELNLLLDY